MIAQAELEYVGRMILAAVCGILIGYERKNRAKEAGVRTHCVVACASALMMILSKYAYSDIVGEFVRVDPSRVASGVVSGIGFLGAGMIFVQKKTVTGLTTAAGIWATSGIGMAIGAGMYVVGIAAAVIILLIQVILHMRPRNHHPQEGQESASPKENAEEKLLLAALEQSGFQLVRTERVTGEKDSNMIYTITAAIPAAAETGKEEHINRV